MKVILIMTLSSAFTGFTEISYRFYRDGELKEFNELWNHFINHKPITTKTGNHKNRILNNAIKFTTNTLVLTKKIRRDEIRDEIFFDFF